VLPPAIAQSAFIDRPDAALVTGWFVSVLPRGNGCVPGGNTFAVCWLRLSNHPADPISSDREGFRR
jgi:hypothetical protein